MKINNKKTLVLSSQDIQTIVEHNGLNAIMDALIEQLYSALLHYDREKIQIPARSGFHYEKPHVGLVEWMPLMNKGKEVCLKLVGYHPSNPSIHDLPTIVSTIQSYDTSTGHLSAIMDGVLLTALRTGAASAVASRLMSAGSCATGITPDVIFMDTSK